MNMFESEWTGSPHYLAMNVEPWDIVKEWPLEQQIGFYRGCLLKYVMRIGHKDTRISDAKKAAHLASKLVEVLGGE